MAAAERPGKDYSYTNNWPPEELVDNSPSADVVVWSVLSLVALLTGIGALLAVFGRWNWLGWHGRDQHELSFRPPDRVALTPSQKATAGFFLVMGLLFLVQSLVGVASQHYRAEIGGFFGIDTDRFLPFNIVRTWHVQLSIFWVVIVVPRGRHLPHADDRRTQGAQGPERAHLPAAGGAGGRRRRQPPG